MATAPPVPGPPGDDPEGATVRHVRAAMAGDGGAFGWIVERFDPLLLAAARHHLGANLRRFLDPEDLVAEVWGVTFRRLPELGEGGALATPALLRFLTSTLRNLLNNQIRKYLREGRPRGAGGLPEASSSGEPLDRIPAEVTAVTARARASEARAAIEEALADLEPKDREVIVLRGIEQVGNQETAALLGLEPGAVAVRYHRALKRLRSALPTSAFDDLPGGGD